MVQHLHPQLCMRRNLDQLPELAIPANYSVRSLRPGDETEWERIINDSFQKNDSNFNEGMAKSIHFRPERVLFACYNDIPVATASAWYSDEETGYLHMVGTLSSHAGKGLGLQVSLAAMHQLVREGRTKVLLHTDDFRIPAIKTYVKLCFAPFIVHENQEQRWKHIAARLDNPTLLDKIQR